MLVVAAATSLGSGAFAVKYKLNNSMEQSPS
jgi:hypothetical protein